MVFCSTSSKDIFSIAKSLFQGQMEINFQTERQTTVKLAVIGTSFGEKVERTAVLIGKIVQISTANNEKITLNAQKCMCCYFAQEILCCTDISAIIVGLKLNNSK